MLEVELFPELWQVRTALLVPSLEACTRCSPGLERRASLATGAQLAYAAAWMPLGRSWDRQILTETELQFEPETKGLFRAALGGSRKTIAAAFERLAKNEDAFPYLDNRRWNARQTCVELPPDEGSGCCVSISVSNEVFAVITNCNYISKRHERVPSEGLVEFHFVLGGLVVLDLPRDRTVETTVTAATMMVCHQAAGVAYDVSCAPGAFRMISLYVQPQLLTESYGFGLGDDLMLASC